MPRSKGPGPPVRPLKEKELGPFGELSTSNLGAEVPGAALEAPNVLARGADDVDMEGEVAQRGASDAESAGGDEEPRRRNSPSDPTSREIEDHVLTGHVTFRSWCAACVAHGRGRAERHQGDGRKELEDGSKIPVVSWNHCFFGSRNPIGVTTSICAHLIPAKGVDFPSCEKVVKMIGKDLDNLGCNRVVFRCDDVPSILAFPRQVKLAWTGHVVQETSAEGDLRSNGTAESSVDVVKRNVRSIKLAVESASCVELPADHDLLTWPVPCAASIHRRFVVGLTAGQHTKEMWEGALFLPWHSSVSECGACLCSHPTVAWALWTDDLNKERTWDRRMDRTRYLLALHVEW